MPFNDASAAWESLKIAHFTAFSTNAMKRNAYIIAKSSVTVEARCHRWTCFSIARMCEAHDSCRSRITPINLCYFMDIKVWPSRLRWKLLSCRLVKGNTAVLPLCCLPVVPYPANTFCRGLNMQPENCAVIAFTKRDIQRYDLEVESTQIQSQISGRGFWQTADVVVTYAIPKGEAFLFLLTSLASFSSNAGGCSVESLLRVYTALCEGLLFRAFMPCTTSPERTWIYWNECKLEL